MLTMMNTLKRKLTVLLNIASKRIRYPRMNLTREVRDLNNENYISERHENLR